MGEKTEPSVAAQENVGTEPRKVVQITAYGGGLCALADDGTLWKKNGYDKWLKLPDLPRRPSRLSGPLVEVAETSRGNKIYRQENGAGGHIYWSDSIACGVIIYDTCLSSKEEIEVALRVEGEFQRGER